MTDCNGCGHCCDPVALPFTQAQMATEGRRRFSPEDVRFVLEDLTPISRREGLAACPWLSNGGATSAIVEGEPLIIYTRFYRCRHFDPAGRRCTNYDGRPPICRNYPWYSGGPDPSRALPAECSYNADVGRPVAEVAVTLGRKP